MTTLYDWCRCMELDVHEFDAMTRKDLKKHYHTLALKYHPDKNNKPLYNFADICNAYSHLMSIKEQEPSETSKQDKGKKGKEQENDVEYDGVLFSLFAKLVKSMSRSRTRETTRETNDKVFDKVYVLHPTLAEMMQHRIYPLPILRDNQKQKQEEDQEHKWTSEPGEQEKEPHYLFVPLWHRGVVFDEESVVVMCEPVLPNGVQIDQQNNIHCSVTLTKEQVFAASAQNENIVLDICADLPTLELDPKQLFCRRIQKHTFRNLGLAKIQCHNTSNKSSVYDTSKHMHIVVTVIIV